MKSEMNESSDLASQLDQIFERPSGRALDEMRSVEFETGIAPHANGSVLCSFGNTPGDLLRDDRGQSTRLDAPAKNSGRLADCGVQHASLCYPQP